MTPGYIAVGNELNNSLGLADEIRLSTTSASDGPLEDAWFDRACMPHVGMNIVDKPKLMRKPPAF